MKPRTIRVSIRLESDADEAAVLSALEEELGHPPELIRRLRMAPVLVFRLLPEELERIRRVPGILEARREEARPLPPAPHHPALDK